jgi:predicted metal-dependent hydrolase
MDTLLLGEISIEVEIKDIKNIHLSVHPPKGRVRIAAPTRMNIDTIRLYAISKLGWIKLQQKKFRSQLREAPREFLTKEGHYFLGSRYLLKVIEHNAPPSIEIKHKTIHMLIRPGTDAAKKQVLLDEWYRAQLKELVQPLIAKWENKIGVGINELGIRRMKTKWGTCNIEAKRIWLNLELAKKPFHCIEYILVHELIHLLERNHNNKFIAYLNHYLPEWKELKSELNKLPVSHRDWEY